MKILRAAVLAMLGALPAAAAGEWSGEIGAGFLATDGNSNSRSTNGRLEVTYARERWKNTFRASGVNASGEGGTTAERYAASDKVDYRFHERNYAFVVAEYEKDLFGATRERTSQAAGVGRHVLTGPVHLLDVELGAGARQTEENGTGRRRSDAIGRFSGEYEWKFTEKNAFGESLKVEAGEDNVFSESVTELKLAIIGNLSAALSYTVRHNSETPPDRREFDTETAINLVYDFGKEP